MTRKDYILIAAALKEARMHWITFGEIDSTSAEANRFSDGIKACAEELAGALGRDNPRFDRERFLKAAGVQS